MRVVRAVLADNWRSLYLVNITSGPDHQNVGVVTGSLLVGTSSNHGQAEPWEAVDVDGHTLPKHWDPHSPLGGVPFYDGPMRVEHSVLANFRPNPTRNAGALTGLFPNPFPISVLNEAEGLRFVRAKRVLLPELGRGRQGDAGTMFTDVDGSVTGTAGTAVVADPSLLDDASCVSHRGWHASLCSGGYARVGVTRYDGKDIAADVIRQSDGRTVFVRGANRPARRFGLNVSLGPDHVVDFRQGPATRYHFWTIEFSRPGAVRLAVPAPPGGWSVTIWGPNAGSVGSLADLVTGPAAYFHDATTGLIHLRVTPAARGGVIE